MAKQSKVKKGKKASKKASKPAARKSVVADGPMVTPAPKPTDKRTRPNPDAVSFAQAAQNWNGPKADILSAEHTPLDFDSLSTFQYAVMPCNDIKTLQSVYSNFFGKPIDLDAVAKKAKKERSEDYDLRFVKEQLYVRGTLEHLKKVAQRDTELTETTRERFESRLKADYSKVKHVGKGGEPKSGFATKTKLVSGNRKPRVPTILGVRENAAGAEFCRALVKAGKMTKREMAKYLGSNTGNYIRRLGGWGSILVDEPKKDATPDNTIIKPNPAWKEPA